jgi:hypothetical protein
VALAHRLLDPVRKQPLPDLGANVRISEKQRQKVT